MKNVVKFLVLMLLIVPLNVASKELILENRIDMKEQFAWH